jgi:hypothetical protein
MEKLGKLFLEPPPVADVDFGDTTLLSKPDGLPLFRPSRQYNIRFALVEALKPKKTHVHYLEGQKLSIRCVSTDPGEVEGICCTRLGDPELRIVALAVRYQNADVQGRLDKEIIPELEVGYLRLSRANFRSISSLPDEGSTVYDLDIVMSMRKSGVGYDFTTIARTPRYLVAGLEAAVKAMCKPYLDGAKLVSKLPPIRSEAEVKALLDLEG